MKIFPIYISVIASVSCQKFGLEGQPLVIDAETLIKFGLIHGKSDPIPPKLNYYQYPNGKIVKRMENFEPGALSQITVPEPQFSVPVSQAPSFNAVSPSSITQSEFSLPFQFPATNSVSSVTHGSNIMNNQQISLSNGQVAQVGQMVGSSIPAAVVSNHKISHYDTVPSLIPNTNNQEPTTIDVPANIIPVNFIFRSASSVINVEHKHEGATGSFKETLSTDEPHQLHHTVQKPIIQQVREIISPYRKVIQEVEPVREEIDTMVAKGMLKAAHLSSIQAAQQAQNEQQLLAEQQQHHSQSKLTQHHIGENEHFSINSEKHLKKIPISLNKNRLISFKPNLMQYPSTSSLFNYKSTNDVLSNSRAASSVASASPSASTASSLSNSALHHPFASFSPKSRSFFLSSS